MLYGFASLDLFPIAPRMMKASFGRRFTPHFVSVIKFVGKIEYIDIV